MTIQRSCRNVVMQVGIKESISLKETRRGVTWDVGNARQPRRSLLYEEGLLCSRRRSASMRDVL